MQGFYYVALSTIGKMRKKERGDRVRKRKRRKEKRLRLDVKKQTKLSRGKIEVREFTLMK